MRCLKCGFEQPDGGIECIRCGIVFAKYAPKKKPAPEETPSPVSRSAKEEYAMDNGLNLKRLLFEVNPEVNAVYLAGRALVFLAILAWGIKFIFTPMKTNYAGESFMHLINLPFHEAGHILFRIFGQFMATLGGSLAQLIVPLICLMTFLLKTKDTFAASVSLWWLAESLMDLAPYIDDARSLELILIGGVTGKDVEDYHDWEFILSNTRMLEYDHLLAGSAHFIGIVLMLCSLTWGGFLLYRQFRVVRYDRGA